MLETTPRVRTEILPRVFTMARLRIGLLSYLLSVPASLGLRAEGPYLDIDLAMRTLTLPAEQRKDRRWQREFFARQGVDLEARAFAFDERNTLNFQGMRKVPLRPLNVELLREVVKPDYVRWINRTVGPFGLYSEAMWRLALVRGFRRGVHALEQRTGVRQQRLLAYNAYLTLPLRQPYPAGMPFVSAPSARRRGQLAWLTVESYSWAEVRARARLKVGRPSREGLMKRRRGWSEAIVVLSLALLAASLMAAAGALAGPPAATPRAPAHPDLRLGLTTRGDKAVRALGADLPAVARAYGISGDELGRRLRGDQSLAVDAGGHLLYTCGGLAQAPPATASPADPSLAMLAPLADTFALHSSPGAGGSSTSTSTAAR